MGGNGRGAGGPAAAAARLRPLRPAPLEVLRIQRPDHSLTCIRAFSGTLRHLIMPEVPEPVAGKLPAMVATLTGLQVPAGRAPQLRHPLLTRAIFCGSLMFGISG